MTTEEKIDEILSLVRKLAKGAPPKSSDAEVADDADLDGKFGNEEIRKMPTAKYWSGEDFTGFTMSNTTADFLDAFAKYKSACAYMNEKSGDEAKAKYVGYDRRSAARARGWAKRLRDGWTAPKTAGGDPFAGGDDSGEFPF